MPKIKLHCIRDKAVVEADVELGKCCGLLKTMIEVSGMDVKKDEYCSVCPVIGVDAAILRKALEWATHHKDDPPPSADDGNREKRTDGISSWDAEFFNVDLNTIRQLATAAGQLELQSLMDVTFK